MEWEIQGASSSLNLDCFKKCKVFQESQNGCRRLYTWFSRNLFAYQANSKLLSAATLMDWLVSQRALSGFVRPRVEWGGGVIAWTVEPLIHIFSQELSSMCPFQVARPPTQPTNRPNECLSKHPKSNSKMSNQNSINIPISCSLSRGEMEHKRSEGEDRKSK